MALNMLTWKIPRTFIGKGIARPGSGRKTTSKRSFHLSALILKNKKLL